MLRHGIIFHARGQWPITIHDNPNVALPESSNLNVRLQSAGRAVLYVQRLSETSPDALAAFHIVPTADHWSIYLTRQ